ncbi:SxtJ family membrane protein [Ferrovibrio terrae]|uniref:SxtJ family membrane protein n=1 Tax=Ferrovibrio terrae TaxID=2594003 RepID=UPI003137ED4F
MGKERQFGILLGVVFAGFGLLPLLHGAAPVLWCLVVAGLLLLIALALPALLRWPLAGWMKLGGLLHHVTSPLLMGLIFFGLFLPANLVMRLLGKLPIKMGFDHKATTYWIAREQPAPAKDSMKFGF